MLHGQGAPVSAKRVLFIGNSLTAWNDLPEVVGRLAEADGQPRPVTRMVAVGGYSLEDHWNQGDARRAIAEGVWHAVVLQQGPSALFESRRLLIEYARRFGELIRKANATPALYMVWPSRDRRQDYSGVSQSYRAAAKAVDGVVLPAGDAWRLVLQRHRSLALYSEDGLHPTFAGTYLTALVIYQGLYGRSPIGLPGLGLPAAEAQQLQEAALDVRDSVSARHELPIVASAAIAARPGSFAPGHPRPPADWETSSGQLRLSPPPSPNIPRSR